MRRWTMPSASPAFSTKPCGSWSSCSVTRVVSSSIRWKVTTPDWWVPSSVVQATRSSGCCSVTSASNSRVTPAIFVTQCVFVGLIWSIRSTPSMNCGNDSNCVHWL